MKDATAKTDTPYAGVILIVDDTPANLRLLSSMLTQQNYKVRMAPTGRLALLNAQSSPPDLILLDIKMPDMSGYDVCAQLKADPRTQGIPVIFISALDQTEDKVKAFTSGGVDYIVKPFRLEEVVARVKTHVALHALQHRLEEQNLELRKLSLAIEQSASSIVITDASGTIQYVNPFAEEVTGYTLDEMLGENPRILQSGEQSLEFYQNLWQTITRGQIWRGEFHNRRKDGSLFWESATIAPVHDSAGKITNYIAIKEDITEQKQAQESLQQYAEQLTAQNAELDAFAHTVAHDLKGPIGVITGFAEVLIRDLRVLSLADLDDSLHRMLRVGQKLDSIMEELMLLAGIRKQTIVAQPLEMGKVVREVIERLQVRVQERQAEITLPDEGAWPVAMGHAGWIEEVWANYISNAIKYGGQPPQVTLGATPQPDGQIRFWVQDNGLGLSEEAQQRLFTPFTRLDQARIKGHGLGLSVVRRIIEKLGGQVGVESTPGQGSTFYFTLPAKED
ncbi:MAG: response regulator [Anaerolineae bacterium]|nr:response regulator [Anaerolineae bacterium]